MDTSRAASIFGPDYAMEQVCKGCQQRHRCASCLDDSPGEYLPPSALVALAAKQPVRESGCSVMVDANGRAFGFMCRRGR